jgi:hypothetical protein
MPTLHYLPKPFSSCRFSSCYCRPDGPLSDVWHVQNVWLRGMSLFGQPLLPALQSSAQPEGFGLFWLAMKRRMRNTGN